MSNTRYVLAIDNGSQSTKVAILGLSGEIYAQCRVGLRPYEFLASGRVVHPDDDVWESIVIACRRLITRFAGNAEDIVAIGLCTIRCCRAYLDQAGKLTEPLLSWQDARLAQPYQDNDPRVAFVTTSSGYISHRMTGMFYDTSGNHEGIWPIDQATWDWSSDSQDYLRTGIPRAKLFDLVPPGALLGTITAEAARATSIPAGLPVFATSNDKAVEALGAGLQFESQVLLSLGTYTAAMTIAETSSNGANSYWVNFGSRSGQYLNESTGIRRGMWTLGWFRSLLEVNPLFDEKVDHGDDEMYKLEAQLNIEAANVAVGSNGLVTVLDWLAPVDEPFRRGAFLGFDGTQGRAHIYRSILEAIACTMADHIFAMADSLEREFKQVVISGGGGRSGLMMQIVADVLDLPVIRPKLADAALMGAGICAAVGAGLHSSWTAAVLAMVQLEEAVAPSTNVSAYALLRNHHRELRAKTAAAFLS